MAKRKKTEPVNPAEEQGRLAAAKAAVVGAAEKAAEVVAQAVEVVKEKVVEPVVKAVKKPKKARYVREPAVPKPTAAAPMPKPSSKPKAKLMSKNVVAPLKEEPQVGKKPKV